MIHGNGTKQQWIWYNKDTRPHWGWTHHWEHIKKDKHWISTQSLRRNHTRGTRRHNQNTSPLDLMETYCQASNCISIHNLKTNVIEHKYANSQGYTDQTAITWKTYANTDELLQTNPYTTAYNENRNPSQKDSTYTEKTEITDPFKNIIHKHTHPKCQHCRLRLTDAIPWHAPSKKSQLWNTKIDLPNGMRVFKTTECYQHTSIWYSRRGKYFYTSLQGLKMSSFLNSLARMTTTTGELGGRRMSCDLQRAMHQHRLIHRQSHGHEGHDATGGTQTQE
jgi:hypothetical protein